MKIDIGLHKNGLLIFWMVLWFFIHSNSIKVLESEDSLNLFGFDSLITQPYFSYVNDCPDCNCYGSE